MFNYKLIKLVDTVGGNEWSTVRELGMVEFTSSSELSSTTHVSVFIFRNKFYYSNIRANSGCPAQRSVDKRSAKAALAKIGLQSAG